MHDEQAATRAVETARRAEEMANRQAAQFAAQSHRIDTLERWRDGLREGHDCTRSDMLSTLEKGLAVLGDDWRSTRRIIIGATVTLVVVALSACFWMGTLAQKVDSQSEAIERIERAVESGHSERVDGKTVSVAAMGVR